MVVRPAIPSDAPGAAWVHFETWRVAYRDIVVPEVIASRSLELRQRQWAELLADPARRSGAFVAAHNDEVVGFATGGAELSGQLGVAGEIYSLYVLPAHHRGGVGRRLVRAVAGHVSALGHRDLLIWVLADNPARGFYERLGGVQRHERAVEFAGVALREVGYVWPDISALGQ
ncbi:MAG: GNAT family N-acetyltransferase [Chloroflexota bacterium]